MGSWCCIVWFSLFVGLLVGTEKRSSVDGVFLAHMLVLAVLALVLYLLFTVVLHNTSINTKAEKALRENAKLQEKIEQAVKKLEDK